MNVRNSVFKPEKILIKDIWSFSSWDLSSHHCQVEMNGKNLPHVHRAKKSNFKEEKEEHKKFMKSTKATPKELFQTE